jgi:hypothetical protein
MYQINNLKTRNIQEFAIYPEVLADGYYKYLLNRIFIAYFNVLTLHSTKLPLILLYLYALQTNAHRSRKSGRNGLCYDTIQPS